MSAAVTALVVAAALGAALVGGVFFAFSSFVMAALARLPAAEGIAAMQSINVVVINRSFLGTFMGAALLSLLIAIFAIVAASAPAAPYLLAGAVAYLAGTFGVTILGNVPLNERLAGVAASGTTAVELWAHYLERWTRLNTLRTCTAALSSLLFILALLKGAP